MNTARNVKNNDDTKMVQQAEEPNFCLKLYPRFSVSSNQDDFTRLDHNRLLSSLETHRDGVSECLHPVVLEDHVLVLHGHNQVPQCVCVTQWEIAGSIFSPSHNSNELCLEFLHKRDTFLNVRRM
jgi:hypothetical protein